MIELESKVDGAGNMDKTNIPYESNISRQRKFEEEVGKSIEQAVYIFNERKFFGLIQTPSQTS